MTLLANKPFSESSPICTEHKMIEFTIALRKKKVSNEFFMNILCPIFSKIRKSISLEID